MKVVQINATANMGSTGKIAYAIKSLLDAEGNENYIFYSLGKCEDKSCIKFGGKAYIKIQALKSRLFGNFGFGSKRITRKMIKKLDEISPDIVHLHNVHSHNVNLSLLLKYLEKKKIKVVWTFHDCWAFTGYCPHYEYEKCDKWQNGCKECVLKKNYSFFSDKSERLYKRKKELVRALDLTVVTPSEWLKNQVEKSFLKDKKAVVINNGIDLATFKPIESDFKKRYGIEDKFIVLGVSYIWNDKKGLDVFIRLANELNDNFKIVMVGVDGRTAKKLRENVIAIERTESREELAEIYSAADVFVNPTLEDTFPTVNIESLACGTPVITFDVGGSPEIIDKTCGIVVKKEDTDGLIEEIVKIKNDRPFTEEACVLRSKQFDCNKNFAEYIKLYKGLIKE